MTKQLEQLAKEQKESSAMKSGLKVPGQQLNKKNVRIRDPADQVEEQKKFLDVIDTIDTVSDVIESGYQSTIMTDKSSGMIIRKASRTLNDFELSESYL